jgi:hypothetical protein
MGTKIISAFFWPNFCNSGFEYLLLQAILGYPTNLGKLIHSNNSVCGNFFQLVFTCSLTDNRL